MHLLASALNINSTGQQRTFHQVVIRLLHQVLILLGVPSPQNLEVRVSVGQSASAARPVCIDNANDAEMVSTGTACQHDADTLADLCKVK